MMRKIAPISVLKRSAPTRSMAKVLKCDAALHELIFIAARNELLIGLHAILKFIRSQEQWLGIKRRSFSEARRAEYCAEHAAIVQALLDHNSDAAERSMLAHLETVGRNLLTIR